jgi:hypothetical protein
MGHLIHQQPLQQSHNTCPSTHSPPLSTPDPAPLMPTGPVFTVPAPASAPPQSSLYLSLASIISSAAATSAPRAQPRHSLDLALPQAVPMLEKAICMQAELFAPSRASTFSEQIVDFRNGGLILAEVDAMQRYHHALQGHPRHSRRDHEICGGVGGGAVGGSDGSGAVAASAVGDAHYLPEPFNYNLVLAHVLNVWHRLKQGLHGTPSSKLAGMNTGDGSSIASSGAAVGVVARLQQLSLMLHDAPAMAAANRFVAMYTSPAFVALHVPSPPNSSTLPAMLNHVASVAQTVQARALYVSWGQAMRLDAQQELLQQLRQGAGVRHVVSLLGEAAEQLMIWSKVYRGDGHARHAEPAVMPAQALADKWIFAKAAVLLVADEAGAGSGFYAEVAGYRRLLGFGHSLDGSVMISRPGAL